MKNAGILIVASECKHACEGVEGLEAKLRAAFKVAANNWMVLDQDEQLKGAIAGVMLCSGEEDKELLTREYKALAAFSAGFSGLPINFAAIDIPENPVGIMRLWEEATGKTAARSALSAADADAGHGKEDG